MSYKKMLNRVSTTLCTLILLSPVAAQAATDEDIAAMREQLMALSERLDRLESENRELTATNAELVRNSQETAVTVAAVSEKTDAVATDVEARAEKTKWTETIRWKGDFRYRYESFDVENQPNRDRNRIRARAALIADVTPTIEVGLGLASGGDDPVSSNQTLGGGGSTKDLRIDLAYFDWDGLKDTHVYGGKFSNYIHRAGKNALLWDGDWRPEGTGIKWNNGMFFANGLGTWIESDSKEGQSFAYLTQLGVKFPIGDNFKLTTGVGYHVFDTAGSGSFFGDDDDFFGNSFDPVSNTYLYDYEDLEFFADLGFEMFGHPALMFGNYVQNQAVDEDDTGWAVGFKYGAAKNKGEWQFGYVYQRLEKDAVLGLLTDSDFGGGGTNSKGSIIKGSYAIYKNFNANLTYFINDVGLDQEDPIDFKRLQLDLSFKY
ncbi:MAG: putative porin [Xanthomonadales bacterium]|nr:putative porin [Xanthomonadales bacterium]